MELTTLRSSAAQLGQAYAPGFADDLTEISAQLLTVQGRIPDWLNGTLLRNGPAMFHVGKRQLAHWFDGFAKLHKFDFGGGRVTYSSRFIQSQSYRAARASGKLQRREFASSPQFGLVDRLTAVITPRLTDNTNVNVLKLGEKWLALTETNNVVEFLPESLDTVGLFKFDDNISAQLSTAHPVIDPKSRAIFNLHVEMSINNHYLISYLQPGQRLNQRRVLVRVPVSRPAYMHSFAQTERHLVIVEPPLRLKPTELIFGMRPFIECYQWCRGMGTRFIVIDKSDGSYFSCEYPDRFLFHQVNAFEAGGVIELDMLTYPNAKVIDSLRLKNLESGGTNQFPQLERFQINLKSKKIQAHRIGACALELPQINYEKTNCSPHRYIYGAGASSDQSFLNQIVKVDVNTGSHIGASRMGCYYGEPVFVGRPGGVAEDDGVLLCIELESAQNCSRLLIIDARTMSVLAEAQTPNMVPFGFHGAYFAGRNQ